MTASDVRQLCRDAADELHDAPAEDVLRWAVDTFADGLCVAASMADAVVIDLATRVAPGIAVIFLDTGLHFPETLRTAADVARRYPISLQVVRPELDLADQDARFGPKLYQRDPDTCCRIRKVTPLRQALQPFDAWITGLRREESPSRTDVRAVEWDAARQMVKVNPLAAWTQADVDRYIAERDVPVNPLVAQGYPSIGCAPCTAAVRPGQHARSGRWAGQDKLECGLHVDPDGRIVRASTR